MSRIAIASIASLTTLALFASTASGETAQESDAAVYTRECALCHEQMGTGTLMLARRLGEDNAILAQRTDLQPLYVQAVVRNGIGSMPAITRVEVTDSQLEQIVRYLTQPESREASE